MQLRQLQGGHVVHQTPARHNDVVPNTDDHKAGTNGWLVDHDGPDPSREHPDDAGSDLIAPADPGHVRRSAPGHHCGVARR